jgi:hypothetical protein
MNERMAPQLLEQKSISAWYWPSVVLILTGLLVILIDAPLSEAIGKLAEPNTWQRRIIKQSYRVFTKYTFIGVAVVLLFKRQRKNLLIGYGTALGLGTADDSSAEIRRRPCPSTGRVRRLSIPAIHVRRQV